MQSQNRIAVRAAARCLHLASRFVNTVVDTLAKASSAISVDRSSPPTVAFVSLLIHCGAGAA